MARLVKVSHEEVLDFNYPKDCLRPMDERCYWDFYLVDERRRRRMRRRVREHHPEWNRAVILALPFQAPDPALFELIKWVDREHAALYGTKIRQILLDEHG